MAERKSATQSTPNPLDQLRELVREALATIHAAFSAGSPEVMRGTANYLAGISERIGDIDFAAVMPAVGATLFGRPVGDGLDQERRDAAAAVSILRKLLASSSQIELTEDQLNVTYDDFMSAATVPLTTDEAELLRRLRGATS